MGERKLDIEPEFWYAGKAISTGNGKRSPAVCVDKMSPMIKAAFSNWGLHSEWKRQVLYHMVAFTLFE